MRKGYTKVKVEIKNFCVDVITMSVGNATDNIDGDIF